MSRFVLTSSARRKGGKGGMKADTGDLIGGSLSNLFGATTVVGDKPDAGPPTMGAGPVLMAVEEDVLEAEDGEKKKSNRNELEPVRVFTDTGKPFDPALNPDENPGPYSQLSGDMSDVHGEHVGEHVGEDGTWVEQFGKICNQVRFRAARCCLERFRAAEPRSELL